MNTRTYTTAQVALHWLSALFILWALVMGFYVSLFNVSTHFKEAVAALNVSLATLFIPFFILRFYLRVKSMRERKVKTEPLVSFIHNLIYAVTGLVLVTGVLMMDRPIDVFDWFTLPQPITHTVWLNAFMKVHLVSNGVLGILVALHVLAVVKHEWAGTRVLQRMRFGVRHM